MLSTSVTCKNENAENDLGSEERAQAASDHWNPEDVFTGRGQDGWHSQRPPAAGVLRGGDSHPNGDAVVEEWSSQESTAKQDSLGGGDLPLQVSYHKVQVKLVVCLLFFFFFFLAQVSTFHMEIHKAFVFPLACDLLGQTRCQMHFVFYASPKENLALGFKTGLDFRLLTVKSVLQNGISQEECKGHRDELLGVLTLSLFIGESQFKEGGVSPFQKTLVNAWLIMLLQTAKKFCRDWGRSDRSEANTSGLLASPVHRSPEGVGIQGPLLPSSKAFCCSPSWTEPAPTGAILWHHHRPTLSRPRFSGKVGFYRVDQRPSLIWRIWLWAWCGQSRGGRDAKTSVVEKKRQTGFL